MTANRWVRLAAAAAGGALVAAAAAAEPAGGLAPAGDCAEPRLQVRGEPGGVPPEDGDDLAAPWLAEQDTFAVAGSPRDHFDPREVGATRAADPRPLPPAPPVLERGACDAPSAVCVGAVPRATGSRVIAEPPPGTPGQPGAGVLR